MNLFIFFCCSVAYGNFSDPKRKKSKIRGSAHEAADKSIHGTKVFFVSIVSFLASNPLLGGGGISDFNRLIRLI